MRLIESLSRHVTAKTRLAIGLVGLVTSSLLLAMLIGLIPDERPGLLRGRARLSEAIAVYTSALMQRGDQAQIEATLAALVQHNPEIVSAGVRDLKGNLQIEIGPHTQQWQTSGDGHSTATSVHVPIFKSQHEKWGNVEIGFLPLEEDVSGWTAFLHQRRVQLAIFVSSTCFMMFYFYLSKMLQHLDPSQAVPTRVRSALDTLAEGLLVLDRKERIVLANSSFAEVVGCSADKLLGRTASQFAWSRDDHSPLRSMPWQIALEQKAPVANSLLNLIDGEGVKRTFIVNCSPVLGGDGQYRGVLASFDDVTSLEQKKIELREASERADAANQAKTAFLANMSHEIRTPMNAILGFADVLRRGYADSAEEQQRHLSTIHSSGKHLLSLINDILDLSKVESGKFQVESLPVPIHDVLSELINVLSAGAADKGLSVTYHSEGPIPETIQTDPTRVRQIITNLVGNAIKFTETGSVTVIARLLEDATPPLLEIDVVDTGIGMDAAAAERVFEPFAQADGSITRRFGGTGLGLTISRRFAEALGGGLTASSVPGQGSTFRLRITTGPIAGIARIDSEEAAARRRIHTPTAIATQPQRLSGHILLVDDGESNRQLVQLVLSRAGLTLDTAVNGEEACLMATSLEYDAILMDMQMPVMDGYTATRTLRSRGFNAPIIALTGNAMKGEEEKCLAAGCSAFLSKPIDIDLLLDTVRHALPLTAVSPPNSDTAAHPSLVDSRRAAAGSQAAGVNTSRTSTPKAASRPRIVSSLPMDDADFRAIVSSFGARLREQLDRMHAALEILDYQALAGLAHWLLGAGGTVGFAEFTQPAL
ncbi:MAG: ATP-binding protein, partial [Planctomycetaceae bacterium]